MQPAPYNPNIPQPKNTIATGQINFLDNFMQLFNAFGIDHVPLNAAANAGNHNVIRLNEQPASLTTQVSEIALYSKKTFQQTDELYLRLQGNGTEIQYSNYQIYPIDPIFNGATLVQQSYFSFLPGGIIVYFGYINPQSNPFTFNLNPAIAVNLVGINLCPTLTNPAGVYSSTVAPGSSIPGIYDTITLSSSFLVRTPPPQYYIIFGNTKIS